MTIETGVVTGNIDRVNREIDELLTAVVFKHGEKAVEDIRTELANLQIRADQFVATLGEMDRVAAQAKKESLSFTQSIDRDNKLVDEILPEPVVDKSLPNDNFEIKSETNIIAPAESDDADSLTNKYNENKSETIDNKPYFQMQFDALQVQLSEIVLRLDLMNDRLVSMSSTSNENIDLVENNNNQEPNLELEPVSNASDFITAIQTSKDRQAESFLNYLRSNPGDINRDLVRKLMTELSEGVMKPSPVLIGLFELLASHVGFTESQKKVLSHLRQYHEDRHKDSSLPILPSPWDRGMKDLF